MIVKPNKVKKSAAQQWTAKAKTLPSPTGGWNARDGLSEMEDNDAVTLENWWPSATSVQVRNGYTPWTASIQGYVETLMAYSGPSTSRLFAATSSGTIYNVTTQDSFLTDENGDYILAEDGRTLVVDTASSSTDVTGLTSGRMQYVNITTSAGSYLRWVNGADLSRVYDGTNWHVDGEGAPYDITGVTSSSLVHINMHKERMWFVRNSSLTAYYLATKSLGGALTAFDLTAVAKKGGYLMAMATWTIDAGYGIDDLAVWVTSNGEVIVYRGTDPSSAATWALVGVYEIGTPVGRRCMYKWAGDLLIITHDGVFPMSGALQSSRTNPRVAVTDKVQSAIITQLSLTASSFGWQLIYFPKAQQLYLNVPIVERIRQEQYVMNVVTKAWCKFKDWNAGCWEIYDNNLYYGGDQLVAKAWDTRSDAGQDITVSALQAFNYCGSPGLQKRATMFQPVFYTNGSPSIFGGVNVDFDTSTNTGTIQIQPSLYGLWDDGSWDSAIWAPDVDVRKSWNGARGIGNAFAPTLNADINGVSLEWINSTIVYEEGGIL